MYRILAIDDDPAVHEILHKTFSGEGYECISIFTATQGLKACSQEKPDLVLLGLRLPDADGVDVCRHFKADARLRHIPVLLMSAETSSVENRLEGLEAGAEDSILKPFLPRELLSRIKAVLRMSARPTEALRIA